MKVFLNERLLFSGDEWLPISSDNFNENIKILLETLESFLFLTEISVYFSSVELKRLLNNIVDVEEFSDYSITNPVDRIRTILTEIESIDWAYSKKQRNDHLYFFISNLGANMINVTGSSIAEACEYKCENNEVALINFLSSEFNETNPLNVLRSNINPPRNSTTSSLPFISDRIQTIDFYHSNRKTRIYNWNKKHGENGKGVISNKGEVVSPLLCSKIEAANFLEAAIGFRKTNELYSLDNNKFMVWKCDSIEHNSFHSYHPLNQSEVDAQVKEFINNLNK